MRHVAALMSLVLVAPLGAQESCADGDGKWVVRACFDEPLTESRYGHDVLGGTPEWTRLRFDLGPLGQDQAGGKPVLTIRMRDMIIEDIAPRVSDLDGDARPEVVFVQSSYTRGARLAVARLDGSLATTPFIGTAYRWLAPVGAADLDGDGAFEIAYVDRPHLARTLRVWRYRGGRLDEIAAMTGVTNHRIGENFISGGLRDCGDGPEMVVADAEWRQLLAVRLHKGSLVARVIRSYDGTGSFDRALACE